MSIALVYLALMAIGVFRPPGFLIPSDEESNSLNKAIKIINDYPTDIIILGEDIQFQKDIKFRKIDSISEEDLKREASFKYSFLLIDDRKNNHELKQGEIKLIKDYIYNKGYNVVYLGSQYMSAWDNTDYIADVDGSRGVDFINEAGNVVRNTGFWGNQEEEMMEEYPNILGDVIIYQIESLIRANN